MYALLVALLPVKAQPYAKAVVALIAALVGVLSLFLVGSPVLAAVVNILGALGVYATPNGDGIEYHDQG